MSTNIRRTRTVEDVITAAKRLGAVRNDIKQSQHTPGPWQYDKEHHRIVGLDTRMGCTVIENVCKIMVADGDRETEDANARLIAAAPELLKVCRLLTEPDKQLEVTTAGFYIFRLKKTDVEAIAAAIAKVEGRHES